MATPSLFGMLGDEAAMQRQLDEQRAAKFAEQTQEQRLAGMGYQAGAGLGRAVAGMFGADTTDPVVRKASQVRQLASQFDTTQPEGMMKFAQAVQAIDPNLAVQAAQQAASMSKGLADVDKIKAETEAKTQETSGKQARVSTLVSSGLSQKEAEGIASSDTAFSNYVKAKKVETNNEQASAARALGFEAKPYLSDYSQSEMSKILDKVQQNKVSVAQASAQKPVDVAAIIREIGTTQDVKGKAEAWKAAGDAYKMQVPMIEKLKEVKDALPKTFTGSFADMTLQFGKGLSAFGIPVDRNKLSNTEYMNGVSAQVLQTIARNFPGSLAVKEMDQLVKSKFSSQQQIETITRVINDLQTEIEAGTKSYEQLAKLPETERYTKDLNLLTGQNFSKLKRYRALEQKANSLSGGQKMTAKEVEEAKKLQADLGV
jgi:hypothetical protein